MPIPVPAASMKEIIVTNVCRISTGMGLSTLPTYTGAFSNSRKTSDISYFKSRSLDTHSFRDKIWSIIGYLHPLKTYTLTYLLFLLILLNLLYLFTYIVTYFSCLLYFIYFTYLFTYITTYLITYLLTFLVYFTLFTLLIYILT